MNVDLAGKSAIVTGASQGIGKSIAEALARNGANVILADVRHEQGEEVAKALGAVFAPCDISDENQVKALVASAIARFGKLDIMVNNAGINSGRPEDRVTVDKYPVETWKKIINVDLNGTFYCCREAAAQMIEQGSGSIVNIASIAGVVALRLQIGFVAAKAAIIKMTEAMACELGPHGVRVNTVSPGSTLTEGTRELFYNDKAKADHMLSFMPLRRPGETSEIANAVLFLSSDAASYVTGHNIVVDGGWVCGFNRDF
jgi:NAD(P)-dependent dehydrogenase (short-subunit alcohol dehydrogenase family)